MSINFSNLNQINNELDKYTNTKLLIVTKNQQIEDIKTLLSKNYKLFGENRVLEAKNKYSILGSHYNYELHLIGPLQSNKVKIALETFDVIQTIDRFSLVDQIIKKLQTLKFIKTKNFYIQVNIGDEKQKSGIRLDSVLELFKYSISKGLHIDGLMCIPPNVTDTSYYFKQMINLRKKIRDNLKLSMGMSNDYQNAMKHESNIIRIGSKIFT